MADRWFTFSAGVGLDAAVVERVDRHPALKATIGRLRAIDSVFDAYRVTPAGG